MKVKCFFYDFLIIIQKTHLFNKNDRTVNIFLITSFILINTICKLKEIIMRTTNLLMIALLAIGLSFASCDSAQKSKDKKAKTKKETKSALPVEATTLNINTAESVVHWTGSLVGVYDHHGTLKFKNGVIDIKDGVIADGSFVVDMTTMKPTDENYNPEEGSTKEKLVGHLSSPDFFDVENYPEASFKIKAHTGNKIVGQLTIRGKTHEETVKNLEIKNMDGKMKFHGTMTIDRNKYDVNWKHPVKDKVLSDEIELEIKIKG